MCRLYFQLAASFLLLALATACGGSGTSHHITNAQPEFLFSVVNTAPLGSNPSFDLQTFEFDPATSALTSKSSLTLGSQLVPGMTVDPAGKFLYASSTGTANLILRYSIDSATGALQSAGLFNLTNICSFCQPVSGPGALAFSGDGKFLYYGSSSAGVNQVVGALAVDSAGSLSQVPGSPFPADQIPFLLTVHPSGKFVITENASALNLFPLPLSSVSVFVVDASTGALSEAPGSPFTFSGNANVVGLAMHPSGKFVYATTGLASGGVLGWSFDQTTGALQSLSASPFLSGTATFGGAFNPSGNFFYVSAGAGGGIAGFSVDPNSGALTDLAASPFDQGSILIDPVVDSSGSFLFAVDSKNKALVAFAIDSSGKLTAVGTPTAINGIPGQLTMGR